MRSNNKGMMTIEACILIPMILMLSILFIWLGFFLYNKTLLTECAGIAAIKGSQLAEADNETISHEVISRAEELLLQKTVVLDDVEIEATVDYETITVNITGTMHVPGAIFLIGIYQNNRWEIEAEQTVERLRSCSVIRTMERIRKLRSQQQTEEN